MNILHLTSIIPAPISTKLDENDILIRLSQEYEKKFPGSSHHFIYITPYSNRFLSFFRKKWKEYLKIINKGSFELSGYQITVLGIPSYYHDIRFLGILTKFSFLIFKKRIKNAITQIKPDIIHAHNMHNNIELSELIRRRYGINYIVTARSINKRVLQRIRKGALNPSAIISHNEISAKLCEDIPVNIIPHPVDDIFFKDAFTKSPNIKDHLKIVSVCKLKKLKNIDKVIEALHETKLDFSYTIFGDGQERKKLQLLVKLLNLQKKIVFKGFKSLEIISKELSDFDLFIMPSYPETLGRVYFEAMASGLPVIASKKTGIDGMIEHHKHGYLVDHKSKDEIKEALLHFKSLSLEDKFVMRKYAIEYAQQFTWDVILDKYHALYENN